MGFQESVFFRHVYHDARSLAKNIERPKKDLQSSWLSLNALIDKEWEIEQNTMFRLRLVLQGKLAFRGTN